MKKLIIFTLIITLTIRFFTETFPVLSRRFNFSDNILVPLLLIILFIKKAPQKNFIKSDIFNLLVLFSAIIFLSAILNFDSLKLTPALVFVILYLQPFFWFLIIINNNISLQYYFKTFYIIYLLQFPIILFLQLIPALKINNPDLITGTFGVNGSQMTFFIIVVISFFIYDYINQRAHKNDLFIILLGLFAILAISFRIGWIVFILSIIFSLRQFKIPIITFKRYAAIISVLILLVVLTSLYLNSLTSISSVASQIRSVSYHLFDIPKIRILKSYPSFLKEKPQAIFIGTGPATFISRAYLQFISLPIELNKNVDVAGSYVNRMIPSELSYKYFVSFYLESINSSAFGIGSSTAINPSSSYFSLLFELGMPALLIYLLIYAKMYAIIKIVKHKSPDLNMRNLAFSAQVITLFLLGVSIFDDWFSVTRITTIIWTMYGLIYVEYERNLKLIAK